MPLMKTMTLQEVHDHFMTVRPEGASCPEGCPFCTGEHSAEESPQGGNDVSDTKTYSEDEVKALVAAAVAKAIEPIQSELEQFKSSQETAQVEAQIAAAEAEAEAQITELQKKLDEAVLVAEQATKDRDETVAYLAAEAEKVTQEAELIARRDARISQVAEVVSFPEEYVQERADKWAALEDEEFEALLADYKAVAEKTGAGPSDQGGSLPRTTAMQGTRENSSGSSKLGSAVRDLIRGRQLGIDPRTIR